MNRRIIKASFLFVLLATLATEADAQRTPRRRTGGTTPPPSQQEGTQQQEQNNQSRTPAGYDPYGGVPVRVEASGEGFNDSLKKSLRPDAAFDKSFINERTPLPYEHLRWDDALFAEKVWRELDLREKMNMPFRYRGEDDNGDQRFISILLKAVRAGEVTAFADDRFTTPLTQVEVGGLTAGGDTTINEVRDVNDPNKIVEYVKTVPSFDPEAVQKIRVKEEWVFDREASRMFVRILGIAPLKTILGPNGQERGQAPMFWIYYPDLRPTLARYEVYNPKNMGTGRMTWEELWESRMFASYIIKSTMDNPFNKNIRSVIKDPILALLEGENLKEKIFNYEQDLWSY